MRREVIYYIVNLAVKIELCSYCKPKIFDIVSKISRLSLSDGIMPLLDK